MSHNKREIENQYLVIEINKTSDNINDEMI